MLFHAPSGAGKSSLIQAGLLPELRASFDVCGPTRVNQEPPDGLLVLLRSPQELLTVVSMRRTLASL